jgi:hypothetical protein
MALAAAAAQRRRQKALEAILQDCLTPPAERSKAQVGRLAPLRAAAAGSRRRPLYRLPGRLAPGAASCWIT